ncbi:MAG TPA: hydantoinase/oxoprolinase family protein, partial [Stellaceae bacterium]|nr:hydantoinase/oxoprolinase family protein [Stellaceae bacterium]
VGERVEAIAVCLLHSYLNPAHEERVKEIVARLAPSTTLCVSAEVLPLINEYERTSTTVINAYVRPIVERYLSRLIGEVQRIGIDVPLLLMQSNGGLTTAKAAAVTPMHIIESGPAAGVVGVQALTRRIGLRNAISFDMGGTTAKASLIENGEVTRAAEYQVGAGIVLGSRLLSGAGYTLKVPAIDLAEIGAGGGSILWIDAGGALQAGPHSAGASPGPVAYDQGGAEPTVTDANLALGYLNPGHLVGGALRLNAGKARSVIAETIARPLGMSLEAAAYGAHLIAASNMIRAIKAVSSERGRDPREYALVAFGGNGPIFAAGMAAEIGIGRVLIPPSAGVFSSFGLLYAEVEYYFARTRKRLLRGTPPAELQAVLDGLEAEARTRLGEDGFGPGAIDIRRFASLHYQGQSFELRVPVAEGRLDAVALSAIEEAFGVEHERTYGHRAGIDEPVELVSLEVIGRGIPDTPRAASAAAASLAPDIAIAASARRAYFGPQQGWQDARIVNRSALVAPHPGPCIVEEYDATCLVPPGWTARLDEFGNIEMRR